MTITDRVGEFEYLDDPSLSLDTAEHSLRDIALANRLFGGVRAVLTELRGVLDDVQRSGTKTLSLLDVGTGLADIPVAIVNEGKRRGVAVHSIGLELTAPFAALAARNVKMAVAANACALPFANASVDVITCSLVLHHLKGIDAIQMLQECARVARRRVIVSDLRRSRLAMVLLWIVSFPLRFHPVSRHDGVVSIRRGFTVPELRALMSRAGFPDTPCRSRAGWRVTATLHPGNNSESANVSEHARAAERSNS